MAPTLKKTEATPTAIVGDVNGHGALDLKTLTARTARHGPRGAGRDLSPASASKPSRSRRNGSAARESIAPGEVVVGEFLGMGASGELLVTHPLNVEGEPLAAHSVVPLGPSQVGREVVIAFEEGDRRRPLVLGCIWQGTSTTETPTALRAAATMDAEQLVFTAEKEIVLRCGDASLTLTRAGKVLIRGAYVLSRSSGVNRIKGGSVQIN